jgi:hypothetical protein
MRTVFEILHYQSHIFLHQLHKVIPSFLCPLLNHLKMSSKTVYVLQSPSTMQQIVPSFFHFHLQIADVTQRAYE